MAIRNQKLFDYIMDKYVNADNPVSQKEIADYFGMSIGSIKNFFYRHNLNKKGNYELKRKQIRELYNKDLTIQQIAKLMECSSQYIYYVINKK